MTNATAVGTSGVGPIVPFAGMRPPSTTSFMPELIREAFDYFEKKDAYNSSEQTKEELLSENMKMKELGHRIAEWRQATPDEVLAQRERENTRITSRNILELPGSATGEEAGNYQG